MSLFRKPPNAVQISLAQPGDFAGFYEQNHLSVFRYVMVLCAGNQAEAEDVTGDAFFRAWEKRAQFSGTSAAALGWVITIARNVLIDHRRSESAHPIEAIPDGTLSDSEGDIEDILVDGEQFQDVLNAVEKLSFQQGNILTLRYVLDWRVKTIAGHLGLAENTVSVELRRAIAKLQKQLVSQETPARSAG